MAVTTVDAGGVTYLARCRLCNWRVLRWSRLDAWTAADTHERTCHADLPDVVLSAARRVRALRGA